MADTVTNERLQLAADRLGGLEEIDRSTYPEFFDDAGILANAARELLSRRTAPAEPVASQDLDAQALDLTKRIEREFYHDHPGGSVQVRAKVQSIIRSALASLTVSDETVERGVVAEISAERRRQVEEEGWTAEHDDAHDQGELARAAMCYAYGAPEYRRLGGGLRAPGSAPTGFVWTIWPWAQQWWKPSDRRRDLVKAGALIVAEIERLDRAALGGHHD